MIMTYVGISMLWAGGSPRQKNQISCVKANV